MYRPDSLVRLKATINWSQTHRLLYRLLNNPAPIRPDAVPEHLAELAKPSYSFKVPQLRGNVRHTMEQIMNIFIENWRRATTAIPIAIRTTSTSLAKRCGNKDPKTAYRHILALIEHGFLRAKVHVQHGLQLLINPDLVAFDAATAVVAPQAQLRPSVAPAAPQAPQTGLASLLALAAQIQEVPLPAFLKNSTRA